MPVDIGFLTERFRREAISFGMISYEVPLALKSDTYNGRPLQYIALASQKNHMALYLSAIYAHANQAAEFERKYRETGKKFDVGKSCVRFKTLDDLPLDLIGKTVSAYKPHEFVEMYEKARQR